MRSKGETRSLLLNFVVYVKTQYGKHIKIIRSDNGVEFEYFNFYNSYGIEHQKSCVGTLEQNSVVERKHQHILNVARSLLFQSKLPKCYWYYAVNHVIHLINRLPSAILKNKSPYELLNEKPATYLDLKAFGFLCFASTSDVNRNKLDPRAKKCIFICFKSRMKGYILLDIKTREMFVSRNVVLCENVFPCNFSNSDEQAQGTDLLETNSLHNDTKNNYTSLNNSIGIDSDNESAAIENNGANFNSENDIGEDDSENHDEPNNQTK